MNATSSTDRVFMKLALREASLAQGRTAPNPPVGCVIVTPSGEMIASGFTQPPGEPHAEAMALAAAGDAARGSTLYVTLEPCSHHGRTPPCADAIIHAGVSRVVASMVDPDSRVSGQGITRLREAGIRVDVGPGRAGASRVMEGYLKFKRTGLPFVLLKMAMTLDGKIATPSGDSRWVTGPSARSHVQGLRDSLDAVMVGVGTVLADDPALTVRPEQLPAGWERTPRNPIRVILDTHLRLPPGSQVLQPPGRRLVLAGKSADSSARERLVREGAEVILLEEEEGRVSMRAAMACLGQNGIHSVLLEGGAEVAASAIQARVVDRLLFFVAPKILGGRNAPGPVGGVGTMIMREARITGQMRTRRFGPDIALETDLMSEEGE